MNKVWSDTEKQFIKDHAHDMKDKELLEELSQKTSRKITLQGIRKQRRKIGIVKKRGRGLCEILLGENNDDIKST